jgi:hypothetical protein
MLAAGPIVAQENVASASQISTAADTVTVTDQAEATIFQASSASERHFSSIGSADQPSLRRDHARTSDRVPQGFNFDYGNDQISRRAIDERILDRLGLFDRPDDGGSSRYGVSLEVEKEDGDWNFEVTFTVEF